MVRVFYYYGFYDRNFGAIFDCNYYVYNVSILDYDRGVFYGKDLCFYYYYVYDVYDYRVFAVYEMMNYEYCDYVRGVYVRVRVRVYV